VSREEKRDETALSQRPFLVLKLNFICREHDFRDRFGKIFLQHESGHEW